MITSSLDFENKCPDPVGFLENYWTHEVIPIACKKWSCPHCRKWRKKQILDRVRQGFEGTNFHFLTLTEKDNERYISKHWGILRRRFAHNGTIIRKFFWTKEFTKNNRRHMHLLVEFAGIIPDHNWIQNTWYEITKDAYLIDIVPVKLDNPAGYMAKYFTKDVINAKYETKERRYGFSKGFPELAKQDGAVGWSKVYHDEDLRDAYNTHLHGEVVYLDARQRTFK